MLCLKNNICGRQYILKLLLLMQNIIIVSVFLLLKAYRLLSTGDEEREWEPWEQIQGRGQGKGTAEAHSDLPQKITGVSQR